MTVCLSRNRLAFSRKLKRINETLHQIGLLIILRIRSVDLAKHTAIPTAVVNCAIGTAHQVQHQ